MAQLFIESEIREAGKKNASYKSRQEGKVAAVIYGGSLKETKILNLNGKQTLAILNNPSARKSIIEIKINGETEPRKVIIKDVKTDPVQNRIQHIDLYEISADKEIHVTVPVKLTGKPKGLEYGGILSQIMREVEIKCLPANIPEFIEVNVAALNVGDNLHLSDVAFPEGVVPVTELKRTVAVVTEPESEEKKTEETAEEETKETKEAKDKEK